MFVAFFSSQFTSPLFWVIQVHEIPKMYEVYWYSCENKVSKRLQNMHNLFPLTINHFILNNFASSLHRFWNGDNQWMYFTSINVRIFQEARHELWNSAKWMCKEAEWLCPELHLVYHEIFYFPKKMTDRTQYEVIKSKSLNTCSNIGSDGLRIFSHVK